MRNNQNELTHYLDDVKGQGIHLETQARKYFFELVFSLVNRLRDSKDVDEILAILDAVKWNYSARDHEFLIKSNIFTVLHRGNGKFDNLIARSWGKPMDYLLKIESQKSLTEATIDTFEMLFTLVTARIASSDFGEDLKIRDRRTGVQRLVKAKSVVDENVSEVLMGQAFDVIFRELDRYNQLLAAFDGIDWEVFARSRNEYRKGKKDDHDDDIEPIHYTEQETLFDEHDEELEKPEEEEKEEQEEEKKADKEEVLDTEDI